MRKSPRARTARRSATDCVFPRLLVTALSLLAWSCASSPAVATAPPTSAPAAVRSTPAAKRGHRAAAFDRAFRSDIDSYLVVHDTEALLTRVLSWPAAEQVLARVWPGKDIGLARRAVVAAAGDLPVEIAIGIGADGAAQVGRWGRAGLLLGLLSGAAEVGDSAAASHLQGSLVDAVQGLGFPPLVFYLKMRTRAVIGKILTGAREVKAAIAGAGYQAAVTDEGNRLVYDLGLAGVFDRQDLRDILRQSFPEVFVGDQGDQQLVDAILQLRVRVEFIGAGTELIVKVGPAAPADGAPFRDHGAGRLPATPDLVAVESAYDGRALVASADQWAKEWLQWADTPVGMATARLDDTDLLGDMMRAVKLLEETPDRGVFRIALGSRETLLFSSWSDGHEPAANLADSALVGRLPIAADCALSLSTTTPVGTGLVALLDRVEERLARYTAAAWSGDDEEVADALGAEEQEEEQEEEREDVEVRYYRIMAPARRLIVDLPGHFFPESAVVVGTSEIKRVRVVPKSQRSKKKARQQADAEQISSLPFVDIFLVGKPRQPGTGTELYAELYRQLAKGVSELADRRLRKPVVAKRDLGLGVPTTVLLGDWLSDFDDEHELEVELHSPWHMFDYQGWWVFSTSIGWSKAFLAGKQGPPLSLPVSLPDGTITDYTDVPSAFFSSMVGRVTAAVSSLAPNLSGEDERNLALALELLGRVNARLWVEQRGGERFATGWLGLVAPSPPVEAAGR